jgi:hypothetical protein
MVKMMMSHKTFLDMRASPAGIRSPRQDGWFYPDLLLIIIIAMSEGPGEKIFPGEMIS